MHKGGGQGIHRKGNMNGQETSPVPTCSSHLILIFFFYTTIVVVSIAHLAAKALPIFPVLLNMLNIVIPPALNPMVYALRAQELRVGFQRVLRLDENVFQK